MIPLLLPTQSVYLPGQAVRVEASHPGDLVVTHLGEVVREVPCERPGLVDLGELPVGGYGVAQPSTGASSAVQVCASASDRLRYGFVASFRPGKDARAVARFARRLHLTGIQFYDWAYRHADLLGGERSTSTPSISRFRSRPCAPSSRRCGRWARGRLATRPCTASAMTNGSSGRIRPCWIQWGSRTRSPTSCASSIPRTRAGSPTSRQTLRQPRARSASTASISTSTATRRRPSAPTGRSSTSPPPSTPSSEACARRCPARPSCSTTSTTSRPGLRRAPRRTRSTSSPGNLSPRTRLWLAWRRGPASSGAGSRSSWRPTSPSTTRPPATWATRPRGSRWRRSSRTAPPSSSPERTATSSSTRTTCATCPPRTRPSTCSPAGTTSSSKTTRSSWTRASST